MTEAVHATIYARIGQVDEAYRQWKIAWGDFTAGRPLLLFSEHRNRDRTYFVTGAAGCLQTVLYGFAGFRIDYAPEPGALWSLRLREGGWLSIKPHLPKEWKRVTIRNFKVLGKRYTATITPNGVQVIEGDS
jgi:trehalose/maltose hydrolase-like predicted phosphorylase